MNDWPHCSQLSLNHEARVGVALLLWSVSIAAYAQYTDVHVQVGATGGKGVAVSRGVDCFVITAEHVVRDPLPTKVIAAQRRESPARVHWADAKSDLAVLKIVNATEICGGDYYLDITNPLTSLGVGMRSTLRVRREDGSSEEFAFKVVGWNDEHVTLEPVSAVGNAVEGWSGGMLYISGNPVGVLLAVATGSESHATALRIDRVEALIGSFLALRRPTDSKANPQLTIDVLRKNVNFLETADFCTKLYDIARWLVELMPQLEYTLKERVRGDWHYQIPSLLIPGTSSIYYESTTGGRSQMTITTIGTYTQNLDPEPFERRAEAAVNACLEKVKNGIVKFLALVGSGERKRDNLGSRTLWHLYYIDTRGRYSASIFVYVSFEDDRLELVASKLPPI